MHYNPLCFGNFAEATLNLILPTPETATKTGTGMGAGMRRIQVPLLTPGAVT